WSKYRDWQLVDQNMKKMVFEKDVHDISPKVKKKGYFGISDDGVLTIFKGKTDDKEAIQSFFQIEMKKLESELYRQLQDGIPVQSKDRYQKVLKQLKPYAM